MAEVTLENVPRKVREMFDKAFAAFERGNLDYAINMYLATLALEPRFLRARQHLRAAAVKKFKTGKGGALTHVVSTISGAGSLLGGMSMLKNKPDQALQSAEKLLAKDPYNMTFVKFAAQAAVAASMPEVAVMSYEIAREEYPKDVGLLKALASLYLDVGRPRDARSCYEQLNELRPNDPEMIKALKDSSALDTMNKGGWETAGSYRDVMKDQKGATLLEQESKAVKSGKDLDALIHEMLAKTRREPENMNYKRSLADLYARGERYDEAIAALAEANKMTGGADPQIDRAMSSMKVRKFDADIEALRAAGNSAAADAKEKEKNDFILADAQDRVRRYPNDLQFHYELGVQYFRVDKLNEAIEEFQLSTRNPQRRTRSLYYLAMCFKRKQQYDIATEQLQKAASELNLMDDTKKDIVYEMGSIAELMGKLDKAIEYYKEIYAVDIRYKDVAEKMDKAYKKK